RSDLCRFRLGDAVVAGIAAFGDSIAQRALLSRTMSFIDSPRRSKVRRWLFLIHLWLGLIIGPVITIVSVTGAIVVFRYQLNRMTTPGTAYVAPQSRRLTLDELAANIHLARPRDTFWSVGWGEAGPDLAWNFRAVSPEAHRIHTYINQYTGEITGRD